MHLMIAATPFFALPSFETLRFATLLSMNTWALVCKTGL